MSADLCVSDGCAPRWWPGSLASQPCPHPAPDRSEQYGPHPSAPHPQLRHECAPSQPATRRPHHRYNRWSQPYRQTLPTCARTGHWPQTGSPEPQSRSDCHLRSARSSDCQTVSSATSRGIHASCRWAGWSPERSSGGRNGSAGDTSSTTPHLACHRPSRPAPLCHPPPSAREFARPLPWNNRLRSDAGAALPRCRSRFLLRWPTRHPDHGSYQPTHQTDAHLPAYL
mmetsp:Transcript_7108/g.11595  ORF Transcript_7108/g.11595 Transcript_7108/m.11595 type:complete len:227 (-) Transcript_7108:489-1169(-)